MFKEGVGSKYEAIETTRPEILWRGLSNMCKILRLTAEERSGIKICFSPGGYDKRKSVLGLIFSTMNLCQIKKER